MLYNQQQLRAVIVCGRCTAVLFLLVLVVEVVEMSVVLRGDEQLRTKQNTRLSSTKAG
jgi:sensor domain CHASE-containing protein